MTTPRRERTRSSASFGRRAFLGTVGSVGVGGLAGCLGAASGNTHLPPPDRPGEASDLAYPAHGQKVPDVSVPAPLHGETISPRDFDTTVLLTFFYSHCESVCPRLISALRNVQTTAGEEGYGDEINFLPMTFDPARDTAARLREYAEASRVDLDAGNWYFLRPDGPDRAEAVVHETFGLKFVRTDPSPEMEGYMFTHMALILLVNPSGYVERAYVDKQPVWQDIYEDAKAVIAGASEQ